MLTIYGYDVIHEEVVNEKDRLLLLRNKDSLFFVAVDTGWVVNDLMKVLAVRRVKWGKST
jgi:hypothetical protein